MFFFHVRFYFVLPTPPPRGGAFWVMLPRFVAQNYAFFLFFRGMISPRPRLAAVVELLWVFAFPSKRFRPASPLPCDMAVVFIDVFSPFRIGLPSFPFYLAFLVGFVASPFRGVGVGFDEPHLRYMF